MSLWNKRFSNCPPSPRMFQVSWFIEGPSSIKYIKLCLRNLSHMLLWESVGLDRGRSIYTLTGTRTHKRTHTHKTKNSWWEMGKDDFVTPGFLWHLSLRSSMHFTDSLLRKDNLCPPNEQSEKWSSQPAQQFSSRSEPKAGSSFLASALHKPLFCCPMGK